MVSLAINAKFCTESLFSTRIIAAVTIVSAKVVRASPASPARPWPQTQNVSRDGSGYRSTAMMGFMGEDYAQMSFPWSPSNRALMGVVRAG